MGDVEVSRRARLALAASGLAAAGTPAMTPDEVAHGYVELTLAIGEHDPHYVDAYYGPEEERSLRCRACRGRQRRRALRCATRSRRCGHG